MLNMLTIAWKVAQVKARSRNLRHGCGWSTEVLLKSVNAECGCEVFLRSSRLNKRPKNEESRASVVKMPEVVFRIDMLLKGWTIEAINTRQRLGGGR